MRGGGTSDGKVRFGPVRRHFWLNPEPNHRSGSGYFPEPRTGPSVQVRVGPVRVRGGPERRTGPKRRILLVPAYVITKNAHGFHPVYHKSELLGYKSKTN